MNRDQRLASLLVIFSYGLLACSPIEDDLRIQKQLYQLRTQPLGQIDPLPYFSEFVLPHYTQDPTQRDPFTPDSALLAAISKPTPETALAPDLERIRTPLEDLRLDELSLRGIMQRGEKIRALLLTPDGQLVSVSQGDYLGQNHGRIVQLDFRGLTLDERIYLEDKGWQKRQKRLELSR